MNSERWELVHRLFERALERPTAERAEFVRSTCGDDDELRAELSSLLASHRAEEDVPPLPLEWLGSVAAREVDSLSAGDRVAGRYRIVGLLGRGGMGEVYEAWDEEISIAVALKILRHAGESGDASRRLRLEGLLARTVWHPGVCRVYDVGCHDEDGHATWFLTMELLRGETLAQRLRRRGRLSQDEALAIVRQVAGGLQAAHDAGITHLDLKPGNVMLVAGDSGERALVTDFGTARMTSAPPGEASEGGPAFGTPAYMAPEQVRGEVAGPAADVYALGAMLFEMVTGVVPFAGSSSLETARRRLEEDPPSPRGLAPALDAHWEATILCCLAREANQRFHRAEDVAVALAGGAVEQTTPHDLARPARGALPVERDAFVGREPDVAALRAEFSDARLVTLTGVGGMGKTRLASGYAWRSLDDWPGGVWFCDLTQARGIDGIASALASVFSVPLGGGDPLDQLGRVIAGHHRCLLILDNFEQVAAHAEQTVGRWMRQAPQACFLVTSRERLALDGERTRIVEALSPEAGLELFVARARALLHRFAPSAADERIIGEIVRLTEGIPLALELAAARMRVMGSEQILAQMRNRFRLLAGGTSRHHETLEAAIDGSWELLRPWERAAWAQCSVFEGGFTLEAAEGVLDLGPWPDAPAIVAIMQSLVDKNLLRVQAREIVNAGRQVRFGLYVTLQEYARSKLAERDVAEARHGRWYAHYGSDEEIDSLDLQGGVARRAALALELENLIGACERAITRRDGAVAVAAFRAAWELLELQGPFRVGQGIGARVLGLSLTPADRARALVTAARAEWRSGAMPEATARAGEAVTAFETLGDRRGAARALGTLGTLLRLQGRMDEARARFTASLEILRAAGDRRFEGVVRGELGVLDFELGRPDEGLAHLDRALAIARKVGDRRSEAMLLFNRGMTHYQWGRLPEGRTGLEAALVLHRQMGNRRSEGVVLGGLANLCDQLGERETARAHYETALAIHREVGNRASEVSVLANLAGLSLESGRADEALALYETALGLAREVSNPLGQGHILGEIGELHRTQGRILAARQALDEGEAILRRIGNRLNLAMLLCHRAELEWADGDRDRAHAALKEAETLAAEIGLGPDSELRLLVGKLKGAFGVGL